jgi:hypothetical protein
MKQTKQQYQGQRIFFRGCNLLLLLLAMFTASSALAQQNAPSSPVGAPTMNMKTPVPAAVAAKPAVQTAAAARPMVDPKTGAPFSSTLPERAISVDGASKEEASNDVGMLASDGSLHQGLKVHGHWEINVNNSDGTRAQHHEFENSLDTGSGAGGVLSGLLGGQFSMGNFMVALGYSGNGPCQGSVAFPGWCAMVTTPNTHPAIDYCTAYVCSGTLTETFNSGTNYAGPYSFVLSGSFTANSAGTISSVYTIFGACANIAFGGNGPTTASTISPATCATEGAGYTNDWVGPLTDATISNVAVANGQLVQVIVTITFS